MNKEEQVERVINKLHSCANKGIKSGKYEYTMQAINALSKIEYEWNQKYIDHEIEQHIEIISKNYRKKIMVNEKNPNCILFYDSFGLDHRGLVTIYLKALVKTNKQIVYVTRNTAYNNQPIVKSILKDANAVFEYVNMDESYGNIVINLLEVIKKYKPAVMFEYNQPWDIAGVVVFSAITDAIRYKINLTDHAFWIGTKSFDYCIEFRDYGGIISKEYREISEDKLMKLPFYPSLNCNIPFLGFEFDTNDKIIIFSGGALYKTISKDNIYYRIIRKILDMKENIIFLYAGNGDDTELKKVIEEYPNRVYHIDERKDLFEVMKHIDLYLSTYPMSGGLMSQYAAAAGRLPITLKHDDDASGILRNENDLGVFYETERELLDDVKHLLEDEKYKKEKEEKLKSSLITKDEFENEIIQLINTNKLSESIEYKNINVYNFLVDYKERFSMEIMRKSIANRKNMRLLYNFPVYFVNSLCQKIIKKFKLLKGKR